MKKRIIGLVMMLVMLLGLFNLQSVNASSVSYTVISAIQWEDVRSFYEGMAAVKKGELWGFIDMNGKVVVAPKYLKVGNFYEGVAYAITEDENGDYVAIIIDKTGKVVLDGGNVGGYSYVSASDCSEGIIAFYEDATDCVDYYDLKGNLLAGTHEVGNKKALNGARPTEGIGLLYTYDSGYTKAGFTNMKGKTFFIDAEYSDIRNFNQGLAPAATIDVKTEVYKWGFIDTNGKWVIQPQFESIWVTNMETTCEVFQEGQATIQLNGKWGTIDKTGKILINPIYFGMDSFRNGMACIWTQEGKYGAVDLTGKVVIQPQYEAMLNFNEKGISIFQKDGKWGYVDKTGKEIIKAIYSDYSSLYNGIALVEQNSKRFFVDEKGISQGSFDMSIDGFNGINKDGTIIVNKNKKKGIIKVKVNGTSSPSTQTQSFTVNQTSSKVVVNGVLTSFEAYTINGSNYFKLRDVAKIVSGSGKQFDVSWDDSKKAINLVSNKGYTVQGGELAAGDGKAKLAILNTATIYKDGTVVALSAYTINGNNFFKLRDLAQAFNIGVTWDGTTGTVGIDTSIDYLAQ